MPECRPEAVTPEPGVGAGHGAEAVPWLFAVRVMLLFNPGGEVWSGGGFSVVGVARRRRHGHLLACPAVRSMGPAG